MLKKMRLTFKSARAFVLPLIVFVVFTVMPFISLAQGDFETGDAGDGGNVTDTPLDGGIILLIAAGVVFGIFVLYRQVKGKLAVAA